MLLEYRLSERSSPDSDASTSYDLTNSSRAQRAGMIAAGTAGLAAAYAAGLMSVGNPLIIDMAINFFAALWITSAVPLLISRLD